MRASKQQLSRKCWIGNTLICFLRRAEVWIIIECEFVTSRHVTRLKFARVRVATPWCDLVNWIYSRTSLCKTSTFSSTWNHWRTSYATDEFRKRLFVCLSFLFLFSVLNRIATAVAQICGMQTSDGHAAHALPRYHVMLTYIDGNSWCNNTDKPNTFITIEYILDKRWLKRDNYRVLAVAFVKDDDVTLIRSPGNLTPVPPVYQNNSTEMSVYR